MKRTAGVLALVAVVAVALYFFYESFDKQPARAVQSEMLNAVPQSAALIFETERGLEIPRSLSSDNMIYSELKSTDVFFRIDALLGSLDSAIARTESLRNLSAKGRATLSVHTIGAKDHGFLLVFQVDKDIENTAVEDAINGLFRPADPPKSRTYDGVALYTSLPRFFDAEVHYYVHNGLVAMSFSAVLLEESVRALLQSASVRDSPGFRAVRVTRSSNARGELYINYNRFADVIRPYMSSEGAAAGVFDHTFAQWSALDFNAKANAIRLNGFVLAEDSGGTWLSAMRNCRPQALDLADYMPSNTAYFAFFGYGDFATFRKKQRAITERSNNAYTANKTRDGYDEKCGCDMESLATGWIGSQGVAFIVEPVSEEYDGNRFAAFMAKDGAEAIENLKSLEAKVKATSGAPTDSTSYQGHDIFRLHAGNFYGDVVGEEYSGIADPYVARFDNVVVMARSLNAMRVLINSIDARRTLARDKSFRDLTKEIGQESNILIYSSLSRSPTVYENLLKPEFTRDIEKHVPLLRKFQALVYQVSHYKGELYYNQAFLRYHPGYSPETNALWEARLGAPVTRTPQFFTNHYTGALDIVTQDTAGTLYLLDNAGKTLWKRKLPKAILGDIHQVDVYKNDKYQIFFGTEDRLYLIDRNGHDVEGFPVKLGSRANAAVSVADYDRSRDYRFFVPVQGGNILCFDGKGKPVKGWEYQSNGNEVHTEIRHIRLGKKDYLFALDENRGVLLLDRRGSPRHTVSAKADNFLPGGWAIDKGKDIESTGLLYCDSMGAAYRLGFNNRLTKTPLTTKPITEYRFATDEKSLQVAVLSPGELGVYGPDGRPISETKLDGKGYKDLILYNLPEPNTGVARPDADRIYLFDEKGELRPGFPLFGATGFSIDDMNGDGYYNLVTAGRDGFVYAYAIE